MLYTPIILLKGPGARGPITLPKFRAFGTLFQTNVAASPGMLRPVRPWSGVPWPQTVAAIDTVGGGIIATHLGPGPWAPGPT